MIVQELLWSVYVIVVYTRSSSCRPAIDRKSIGWVCGTGNLYRSERGGGLLRNIPLLPACLPAALLPLTPRVRGENERYDIHFIRNLYPTHCRRGPKQMDTVMVIIIQVITIGEDKKTLSITHNYQQPQLLLSKQSRIFLTLIYIINTGNSFVFHRLVPR